MRKIYLIAGMWVALFSAKAQQTATFEEIELQSGTYYNGSDGVGGFFSGGIWFPNSFSAQLNYWNGFAVSNMKDTTTAGYENQCSAIVAGGADSSENFAVVYCPQELKLPFDIPVKVEGFYITNSVYTYLSMRDGDNFTKKFGGPDGTEPDYFLLMVSGTDAEGNSTDTVKFYLADYQSEDSENDYIIDDWQWLDLKSLGVVSELNFSVESTDMGDWGMNTPAYFCIDNLRVSEISSFAGQYQVGKSEPKIFPNPVIDVFQVEVAEDFQKIILTDETGKIIYQTLVAGKGEITISVLNNKPAGLYFLYIKSQNGAYLKKIMKY